MHAHTPSLKVFGPRGNTVRGVAYCRDGVDEPAQTRINRQHIDPAGRQTSRWDPRLWARVEAGAPSPASLSNTLDLAGKVVCSEGVDAGWWIVCYGAAGQLLERWDGRGARLRRQYDDLLRPFAVFEKAAGGGSEQCAERFTYAGASEEDARRNRCGQRVRRDDPAGSLWHEAFGLSGQPLSEKRKFCVALTAPDWPEVEADREALLQAQAYTTHWRHDALGAMVEQTDALGNVLRLKVDIAGRPHASSLNDVALVKNTQYNAFDQVTREQAGNDVVSTARFSPEEGRLHNLQTRAATGMLLQDLHYQYDPVGNIARIEDTSQPVQWFAQQRIQAVSTYAYDTLYQLTRATGRENASHTLGPGLPGLELFGAADDRRWRNYTQTFRYDSGGNLIQLRHDAGPGNAYTRDLIVDEHSNRSLFDDGSPIDFAKGFDANGNQQDLAPGQAMRWDTRNQLRQVTQVVRDDADGRDDDVEIYLYDGNGQRIRKVRRAKTRNDENISEVRYLPGLEIRTRSTGEQLQVVTVRAARCGVQLLHWEHGQPKGIDNDQLRYSLADHLNSSTLELDQNAELISQESYYPYGGTAWWAARSAIDAKYKTVRYSAKERDATGLYYYGFRYYAPWLNRWINPDPAGEIDGLNMFGFVSNRPVSRVDIDGRVGGVFDGPANKKPRMDLFSSLDTGASSSGFSSLFSDISNASGELARRSSIPTEDDGMFSGKAFDALLNSGAYDKENKRLFSLFSEPLGIRFTAEISGGLNAKRKDPAPRATTLSNEEYLALRFYLSPAYYKKINTHLRQGPVSNRPASGMGAVVTHVVSALGKLDSPSSSKSFRVTADWSYPAGSRFTEKGLFSTTSDLSRANRFAESTYNLRDGSRKTTAIVFGNAGRKVGSGIDEGLNSLQEVIYAPGSQFNILLRATAQSGAHWIVMEQAGSNAPPSRLVDALTLAPRRPRH